MTTDRWKVEVVKRIGEDELDWWECAAGPAMRGRVGEWLKNPRARVFLVVHFKPSFRRRTLEITKDGQRFRAKHGGQQLTLEAAVKKMKEELESEWRTHSKI